MDRISESYGRVQGIRTSVKPGSEKLTVPQGASHVIRYGDRIFVRLVNLQRGWMPVAEFELNRVADMSEIYGELRHRTAGQHGLMRLYVRNATRGWSFEQPFKIYGQSHMPASSITRPIHQPQQCFAQPQQRFAQPRSSRQSFTQPSLFATKGERHIPDSIKTYEL